MCLLPCGLPQGLFVSWTVGQASGLRAQNQGGFIMTRIQKNSTLYAHPFSRAYWRDAANELKDTKMLVLAALMIALRVALKPFAIPLGPQLNIQTAMLATALGAMIYGPVVAIPSAIISDTIGFMLFPTGDYFLPFVLTEIASTMLYALLLYRTKLSAFRVVLARFFICFFVNVIMQTGIFAWQYAWMGNPEKAKDQVLGIFTVARIFKNLCMFPLESVVLTLFLKLLLPITRRAKLTYDREADLKFTPKQIIALVCLVLIGAGSATGYLAYRYTGTSRSADYTDTQRVSANKEMTALVLDKTDDWDDETVVCIVDSAYRPLFADSTDYTVSVYVLDQEAFAAGTAASKDYTMDTLWGYSKSGPKKDQYQSLIKVATATIQKNEKTGQILTFEIQPVG